MRKVVIDMQNYLFSDAIAKVLKSYDSDFFIEMSDTPDKTAELCRVIQPHILMMEITGQALWSLKERLAICREVRRYAPNCKFIFTVDEKANDTHGEEITISTPDSKVLVMVIPTNEELAIARETLALVK